MVLLPICCCVMNTLMMHRVAPSKPVSIPRMELTAAVLAASMDKLWRKELRPQLEDSVFWTDSTSVLKYIKNETSRFRVFVANRVSEILKISDASQWRFVNTVNNPADLAYRGVKAKLFINNKTLISGPSFLLQSEENWPVNSEELQQLPSGDPEVKVLAATGVSAVRNENDAVTCFCNPRKMKEAMAHLTESVSDAT